MKTISLCGRPDGVCCPLIKEDAKNGVMYIIDGDQKIAFNKEQIRELTEYLYKRAGSFCKCASCLGKI